MARLANKKNSKVRAPGKKSSGCCRALWRGWQKFLKVKAANSMRAPPPEPLCMLYKVTVEGTFEDFCLPFDPTLQCNLKMFWIPSSDCISSKRWQNFSQVSAPVHSLKQGISESTFLRMCLVVDARGHIAGLLRVFVRFPREARLRLAYAREEAGDSAEQFVQLPAHARTHTLHNAHIHTHPRAHAHTRTRTTDLCQHRPRNDVPLEPSSAIFKRGRAPMSALPNPLDLKHGVPLELARCSKQRLCGGHARTPGSSRQTFREAFLRARFSSSGRRGRSPDDRSR
jgi:hypothetical protein